MACAGQFERSGGGVEHSKGDRHHAAFVKTRDEAIQGFERPVRRWIRLQEGTQRAANLRHCSDRHKIVSRDVSDDQRDPSCPQIDKVIEVTADLGGAVTGEIAGTDIEALWRIELLGQHAPLEKVRHFVLFVVALLTLDDRSNLTCKLFDECKLLLAEVPPRACRDERERANSTVR